MPVADRLDFVTKPKRRQYDVSIYGARQAGLKGLSTVLIERNAVGGQAGPKTEYRLTITAQAE